MAELWIPSSTSSRVSQSNSPVLFDEEDIERAFISHMGAAFQDLQIPPYSPDALIQQKGWDIYDDMMNDPMCRAPIDVKRSAVLYKGISIKPIVLDPSHPNYDEAKTAADFIQYMVDHIETDWGVGQSFHAAAWDILRGVPFGFSVSEKHWKTYTEGPYKGKWGLQRITTLPCKQIGFRLHKQMAAPLWVNSYHPEEGLKTKIPMEAVVHFIHRPINNLPWGDPDLRAAYKHWWSAQHITRLMGVAIEVWGVPFLMAKAPIGKIMETIRKELLKIRGGTPPVLPPNIETELVQPSTNIAQVFITALTYHIEQCAYNILFNTLTTSEGKRVGSMALGEVHQSTQGFGLGYTRFTLADVLRHQIFRCALRYNFGPEMAEFTPIADMGEWDNTDRLKYAQAVQVLLQENVAHYTEPWIREGFGAPAISQETTKLIQARIEEERKMAERQMEARERAKSGGAKNGE